MQRNPSTKQANQNTSQHPTKKGPGRRHAAIAHGTAPIPAKGAFLGQRTNRAKPLSREDKRRADARAADVVGNRQRLNAIVNALKAAGKPRQHKPHQHALRDEHGAFTYIGAQPCEPWQGQKRRVWLGGISAQRGF